jgi:hypothetical protein
MTPDEILWTSPYDDPPELPDEGDLIDMTYDRSETMTNLPQVCELCGGPTPDATIYFNRWPNPHSNAVSKAKRCFPCWKMEVVIRKQPEIARKILQDLETG